MQMGGELGHQPGTPTADRAGDDQQPAAAAPGDVGPRLVQPRELGGPAEERAAGRFQLGWQRRGRGQTPRCGQRRILTQHPLLQRAQLDTRIGTDLLGQQCPYPTQRGQRVGLAPAPVQGRDQLYPELLMQPMRGTQGLRVRDHLGVAAQRQPRSQANLQTGQAHLRQPLCLRHEKAAVSELAVRLPPPQRERVSEEPVRLAGLAAINSTPRRANILDEDAGIDSVRRRHQAVPRRRRHDSVRPSYPSGRSITRQRVPQSGHVRLNGFHGARRRCIPPHGIDEGVNRHYLAGVCHQSRQQPSRHRTAQLNGRPATSTRNGPRTPMSMPALCSFDYRV